MLRVVRQPKRLLRLLHRELWITLLPMLLMFRAGMRMILSVYCECDSRFSRSSLFGNKSENSGALLLKDKYALQSSCKYIHMNSEILVCYILNLNSASF